MKSREPSMPAGEKLVAEVLQRMRQELLSNLAHELRSPLVAIRGYMKMLRAAIGGELDEAQRGHIEVVLENVDRIVALTGRVAHLARYGPWRVEDCDLARILDDAVRDVRAAAEARSIRIVREEGTSGMHAFGDASRLEQALQGLLGAAIAAAREGAEIAVRLTTDREGPEMLVRVASSGYGLDEEEQDSLFERSDPPPHEAEAGRVPALWEADDVVRLHGGRLDYAEIEDGRFAFLLRLPRFEGGTTGERRGQG